MWSVELKLFFFFFFFGKLTLKLNPCEEKKRLLTCRWLSFWTSGLKDWGFTIKFVVCYPSCIWLASFLMISKKCKKARLKITNCIKRCESVLIQNLQNTVITDDGHCLKNPLAKTFTSIDKSTVCPRAILDGDQFPSSSKKYGHWRSFILLDPEERRTLCRKGRKCLGGLRDKNDSPFIR